MTTSSSPTPSRPAAGNETVAVVVVTYNRADLLSRMLEGLAAQTHAPDAVIIVDNASTDHTAQTLQEWAERGDLALHVITSPENLGGAGGFHLGAEAAFEAGFGRTWLIDDDVVPAPDCLAVLMAADEDALMVVREDLHGTLCEKSAITFDLRNPLAIRPKTASVDSTYATRAQMPVRVPVENVAFEGFMYRRVVAETIGLPDPSFFIFYDDVDYAVRARRAGFTIWALRDAVLVRQLDFNQQHDLSGWKGYYMYRNLFVVHLRHGENLAVRLKPYLITAAVALLSPLRGGLDEARNVIRAMRDARGMRAVPGPLTPRG